MCTRVSYTDRNRVFTGRNFDWVDWSDAGLWVYPAGLQRNGAAGDYSCEWVSQYKSVAVSSYDGATADGLNEMGLSANLLWLAASTYPKLGADKNRKALSISCWAQYILDLCKDVPDAIEKMKSVYVVSTVVPGRGNEVECHLSVSDRSGNSAIFEYVNSELMVYTNVDGKYTREQVRIMTNEPEFPKQLQLNAYWELVDGNVFLPGSCTPMDRFVRATYYTRLLPETTTEFSTEALSHLLSVMRNAVEPFEIPSANGDEASPTQYTTLSDQQNTIYYFSPAKNPFMCWIDLNDFVFSAEQSENNLALNLRFEAGGALMENGSSGGGKLEMDNFIEKQAFAFIEADEVAV